MLGWPRATSSIAATTGSSNKSAVFTHLTARWRDLFNISFDVLLYDLTSTYFESDPPFPEGDKRRYDYSRDHRGDCVQVIIALVVDAGKAAAGLRVLPGNTQLEHWFQKNHSFSSPT